MNQRGERIRDGEANLLTVVASENYADYARGYQMEIAEEYRAMIEGKIGKRLEDLTEEERGRLAETYGKGIIPPAPKQMDRQTARATRLIRGQNGEAEFSPEFEELWKRISQKTTYHVQVDDKALVRDVVSLLREDSTPSPRVQSVFGRLSLDAKNDFVAAQASGVRMISELERRDPLPNMVELILRLLRNGNPPLILTQRTVFEIFRRAADDSALQNPTGWAAMAARVIRGVLGEMTTNGVEYRRIESAFYDWEQWFTEDEREIASALVADMRAHPGKTPYDLVECDSGPERKFAEDLAGWEEVKLFLKLPRRFVVPTPVGNYNPDWAVLLTDGDGRDHLYFVAETKGAVTAGGNVRWEDLRGGERGKIRCATRHFGSRQFKQPGALEGVDYQVVGSARQLHRRD